MPDAAILEALTPAGDGLRASFFWRVDRYAHRLERIEGGAAVSLLESIEGSDLDRWPPSPPLQQLTVEQLPDGRSVALLVGMAGASHWSLTVEREPNAAALVFDVACRVKEESGALGSAYRSLVRQELEGNAALLHRPGGQGQPAKVETLALPAGAETDVRIEVDGRGVTIRPAIAAGPNATRRWKYRISVPT
jgi:hypothetical protein